MIGKITRGQMDGLNNLVPPTVGVTLSAAHELGFLFCKKGRKLKGHKFYYRDAFYRSVLFEEISISPPKLTHFDLVYLSTSHFNFINTNCINVDIYLAHSFFDRFPNLGRVHRNLYDSVVLKYNFNNLFLTNLSTAGASTKFPDFTFLDHCPPGWPDSVINLFNGSSDDGKVQLSWEMFLKQPCR